MTTDASCGVSWPRALPPERRDFRPSTLRSRRFPIPVRPRGVSPPMPTSSLWRNGGAPGDAHPPTWLTARAVGPVTVACHQRFALLPGLSRSGLRLAGGRRAASPRKRPPASPFCWPCPSWPQPALEWPHLFGLGAAPLRAALVGAVTAGATAGLSTHVLRRDFRHEGWRFSPGRASASIWRPVGGSAPAVGAGHLHGTKRETSLSRPRPVSSRRRAFSPVPKTPASPKSVRLSLYCR